MVFSSVTFLYFFLPLVIVAYIFAIGKLRNIVLLAASLVFYAWGEGYFVFLMLCSITINYFIGLLISIQKAKGSNARWVLFLGVALNLVPLLFFKYSNFLIGNINTIGVYFKIAPVDFAPIHLPIGISFFTFQAISYVVDIYRNDAETQYNPIDLALYISLFPQLIAGPIVRYSHVADQIRERYTRIEDIYQGGVRFIIGLGKKVLIANVLGRMADAVFELPPATLSTQLAWIGIISYTLQIYFDFSGYSDMAIGLGRLFGFHFRENFNFPYISKSIREFWQRWHISLSSWFRDYLYIPLGGSRASKSRTLFNLFLVFFLCGLWHGASWTFLIWGLYHGLFLIGERTRLGGVVSGLPIIIRHGYALVVVMIGWVFFRADTLGHAIEYIKALFSFRFESYTNAWVISAANSEYYLMLFIAILASMPLAKIIGKVFTAKTFTSSIFTDIMDVASQTTKWIFLLVIFIYSTASLMGGQYNPFLYFRF